jgi:branched-chain amino acid transport system permease protein
VLAVVFALFGLTLGISAPAHAQGQPVPKTVAGRLVNSADNGKPVPDVTITVTTSDGGTFTGKTKSDGSFSIAIKAAPGPVKVKLDESTLPEGVKMRAGASTVNTLVSTLSILNTTFLIGPDNRHVESKWSRVPGLIYSGLLFGLIIALASLGLSMVFGTTGLTNFAHGELVTFGALFTYWFNVKIGMPFVLAAVVTVIVAAGFGWFQDRILWRPLRRRGTGLIAMMIVTIGLQFFLRNVYQYFTAGRLLNYQEYLTPNGHNVGSLFTYTDRDVVVAAVCILALATALLGLSYTRLGRATRAVADNPGLASATGINVNRVISIVWIVGTALAALSGVFLGFEEGVSYQIGQLVLLLLFASCCVGGLGSVWGAVVGSLIIGVLIDLSTLFISADLKNAGALLLLIMILLLRPQGLLGRRERIG